MDGEEWGGGRVKSYMVDNLSLVDSPGVSGLEGGGLWPPCASAQPAGTARRREGKGRERPVACAHVLFTSSVRQSRTAALWRVTMPTCIMWATQGRKPSQRHDRIRALSVPWRSWVWVPILPRRGP